MTSLTFTVVGAEPARQTAAPGVVFRLRIENRSPQRVHAITLRCQVQIVPRGRRYTSDERQRLYELFGDPSQWDRTLQPVTWAHPTAVVPSFDEQSEVDLPVACTYDLEVASAKYLHAIRDGDVPLTFAFCGTVFTVNGAAIAVEPIAWDLEASFRLPARVWQSTMNQFFPGGGWLRVSRDTIDRLQTFRGRQAVVSWDEAIDLLLQHAGAREIV